MLSYELLTPDSVQAIHELPVLLPWSWPQAADISAPLLARTIVVNPPFIKIS